MRRAFALLAAACLVAPSPAAAQAVRAVMTLPSAPSTPLVLPSVPALPSVLPSASLTPVAVPALASSLVAPARVPLAAVVAPVVAAAAVKPHAAARPSASVLPLSALAAQFHASSADPFPASARLFDGAQARSAASESPVEAGPSRASSSGLSSSRPELRVAEAARPAPKPLSSRLAVAGVTMRASLVLAPILALVPSLTAFIGTDPSAWLGLTGFLTGVVALHDLIPRWLEKLPRPIVLGAAVIGGTALGVAAAALSGWSAAVSAVAVGAVAVAALASSESVRSRIGSTKGSKGLLRVDELHGAKRLWIEPARFGELLLLTATFEKGLGEKDMHAAKADSYERAVYFRRTGDFVELVARDLSRRAAPGSGLEKALGEVSADATIGKARIVATDPVTGSVAVDLKNLALQDFFFIRSELEEAFDAPYSLDEDLSALTLVSSRPRDLEIGARQVYARKSAPEGGELASRLPDARRVTVALRLSLSALPEPGYVPRAADSRLGHFATVYEDWSDDRAERPTRALVNRWRLEKSDPTAAASPVKKPVVFWIDSSVPERYRDAVKKGVLAWNEAFARVGLLGALEVKDAPAGFDSSDARHTVIRWFMDKDAGYAIGQTRVDPFTGEIYQATLGISATHPRSVLGAHFVDMGEGAESEKNKSKAKRGEHEHGPRCGHAQAAARQAQMTMAVLEARGGMSEAEKERFVQDYVTDLTLHEVGHTLGLRHNFLAKTWKEAEELSGPAPIAASVMDYIPANIAPPGQKQGSYWNTELGPYDFWAIEYAYKPLAPGEEKSELARIASRAGEPGHAYATDEDLGLDPDSTPWFLGKDPLLWAAGRMDVVRELWKSLETRPAKEGEDHSATYRAFIQGWRGYLDAARLAAAIVGGLGYRRNSGTAGPFTPVSGGRRRAALAVIDAAVFSDFAFDAGPELRRRLDAGRAPTVDDPWPELQWLPYDELALWLKTDALSRLLDPDLMALLSESMKMASPGDDPLTPRELIETLTMSVWREVLEPIRARKAAVSSSRRRLQEAHLNLLIMLAYRSAEDEVPEVSALARAHLTRLSEALSKKSERKAWDDATRDHLLQSVNKIDSAESRYEP